MDQQKKFRAKHCICMSEAWRYVPHTSGLVWVFLKTLLTSFSAFKYIVIC